MCLRIYTCSAYTSWTPSLVPAGLLVQCGRFIRAWNVKEACGYMYLEGDWIDNAVGHAELPVQAEGGAQVGSIQCCTTYNGLIRIQMPVTRHRCSHARQLVLAMQIRKYEVFA